MDNGDLPLRSFTVEGYRGIRSLTLPELGRVNLFVGKNNAGKTSLLEAIRIALESSASGIAGLLYESLREHTDFSPTAQSIERDTVDAAELETLISAVESLFFEGFYAPVREPIRVADSSRSREVKLFGPRSQRRVGHPPLLATHPDDMFFGVESPLLAINNQYSDRSEIREIGIGRFLGEVPVRFWARGDTLRIPAEGLRPQRIRELWDRLAVDGSEAVVDEAMAEVWPEYERALTAGDSGGRRSVYIRQQGRSRAVPLQSLGDGMQRVFGIAVALGLASGGALVVDEVENGLHHSVQNEVWNAIFTLAERLKVQIFATTHSWEAVVAFQAAANRSPAKGMLYRLEREDDGSIYVEKYTEQDVARAAEYQVEVR